MHIRRSFHLRLFEQSLKRIGAALKDRGDEWPARIGTTDISAELRELAQPATLAPDPLTHPHDLHNQLQHTALLTRLAIELRAAQDSAAIVHHILAAIGLYSNVDAASIVVVGPDGAIELAQANRHGQPMPISPEQAQLELERGPAGWDWRDSASVMLANNTGAPLCEGAGAAQAPSILALPLAHGRMCNLYQQLARSSVLSS